MAVDSSRPSWPDRPLLVGSFVLVLVVAGALFAAVFPAYVTAETAYRIDVSVQGYTLSEDSSQLAVTLAVDNPTPHGVSIDTMSSSVNLHLYVDGTRYSTATDTRVEGGTVPAGESATVTAVFTVREDYRDQIRSAIESGSLVITGELPAHVVEEEVTLSVEDLEVEDG